MLSLKLSNCPDIISADKLSTHGSFQCNFYEICLILFLEEDFGMVFFSVFKNDLAIANYVY